MDGITKAPFTPDQVANINAFQDRGRMHPFTCMSPEEISECLRASKIIDDKIINGTSEGILLATTEGFICPCGKYTQDWCHDFMAQPQK